MRAFGLLLIFSPFCRVGSLSVLTGWGTAAPDVTASVGLRSVSGRQEGASTIITGDDADVCHGNFSRYFTATRESLAWQEGDDNPVECWLIDLDPDLHIVLQFTEVALRAARDTEPNEGRHTTLTIYQGPQLRRDSVVKVIEGGLPVPPVLVRSNQAVVLIVSGSHAGVDAAEPEVRSKFNMSYEAFPSRSLPLETDMGRYLCTAPDYDVPTALRCDMVEQCAGGEDERNYNCTYREQGCDEDWVPGPYGICFRFVFPEIPISPNVALQDCRDVHDANLAWVTDPEFRSLAVYMAAMHGHDRIVVGLFREFEPSSSLWQLYRFTWRHGHRRYFPQQYTEPALQLSDQEISVGVLRVFPAPRVVPASIADEARQGFVCWRIDDLLDPTQADRSPPIVRLKPPSRTIRGVDVKRCPSGYYVLPFFPCQYEGDDGTRPDPETLLPEPPRSLPLFECGDGQERVHYTLMYDGVKDCGDGSDEDSSLSASESTVFRCPASAQYVLNGDKCDGRRDCLDGGDESPEACGAVGCKLGALFCPLEGCLPHAVVDSGLAPCPPPNHTDVNGGNVNAGADVEGRAGRGGGLVQLDLDGHGLSTLTELQPGEVCPETHFLCSGGRCIPTFLLSNSQVVKNVDCPFPFMDDEQSEFRCPGFFRCRLNDVCLHPDHVCDGVYHCPTKDDEMYCDLPCPDHCLCQGYAFTCTQMFNASHQPLVRYLDLSGVHQPDLSDPNAESLVLLAFLNLSSCALISSNARNFSLWQTPVRVLDMSYNHLTDLYRMMFPQPYLTHLDLSSNPLVRVLQSSHFQTALALNEIKVLSLRNTKVQQIEPRAFGQWLKSLERLDIRGNRLNSFHIDTFFGLSSLQVLDTDDPRMCCVFFLRYAFSEASCTAPRDELSSCSDLLRSSFFRTSLWTLALMAVVGNVGVLAFGLCVRKKDTSSGYRVFVNNLCVSDLLMGAYLIIVGSADAALRGQFFRRQAEWTQTVLCRVAGFVALLSSEVSAFLICLITLDRLLVLRFPLSFNLHMTARSASVASAAAWVLGVVLAAVPTLPLEPGWKFYGHTAICIPLPITRRHFSGKYYAFGVFIVFNFMLFTLIAVGQLLIYRAVRGNSIRSSTTQTQQREAAIARRLCLVVVTDFCCWFPVGVMGMLAERGTPIPGDVNVGAAIFVLPLNSALNPFLYTLNTLLESRRKRKLEERVSRMMQKLRVELGSWSVEKLREHLQTVEAAVRKAEVRSTAERNGADSDSA